MNITAIAVFLLSAGSFAAQSQVASPLILQRTIPLPNGAGKFDHFAIDLSANHLFIAATGNGSVGVLDLSSGNVTANLTNFGKPHGLVWIPGAGRLYAADGPHAELKMFEGSPLSRAKSIKLSDDVDDMVYDEKSKLLYVGHGGGSVANPARVAVIDTTNQTLVTNLPVSAHPESLEIDNVKDRIFVNVADAGEVVVIDGATHTRAATWKLTRAKDNV